MTRAAILARVSTTDQADADRHSIPVQTEMMRRLAERNDWDVVRVFEIPGESAYTMGKTRDSFDRLFDKRPQFVAALEAAERGEFEVLIVYDFSRFARNQLMAHTSERQAYGQWHGNGSSRKERNPISRRQLATTGEGNLRRGSR